MWNCHKSWKFPHNAGAVTDLNTFFIMLDKYWITRILLHNAGCSKPIFYIIPISPQRPYSIQWTSCIFFITTPSRTENNDGKRRTTRVCNRDIEFWLPLPFYSSPFMGLFIHTTQVLSLFTKMAEIAKHRTFKYLPLNRGLARVFKNVD